jgi:hypothetical protein
VYISAAPFLFRKLLELINLEFEVPKVKVLFAQRMLKAESSKRSSFSNFELSALSFGGFPAFIMTGFPAA